MTNKRQLFSMLAIYSFFILLLLTSCSDSDTLSDSGNFESSSKWYPDDPNVIISTLHPLLFVIPITPVDVHFHSQGLMKEGICKEEIAYHIISLGILKQDTPEVRKALQHAHYHYAGLPIPLHFDWPDSVERFKKLLAKDPGIYIHFPGNRGIRFDFLLRECANRIGIDPKILLHLHFYPPATSDQNDKNFSF